MKRHIFKLFSVWFKIVWHQLINRIWGRQINYRLAKEYHVTIFMLAKLMWRWHFFKKNFQNILLTGTFVVRFKVAWDQLMNRISVWTINYRLSGSQRLRNFTIFKLAKIMLRWHLKKKLLNYSSNLHFRRRFNPMWH